MMIRLLGVAAAGLLLAAPAPAEDLNKKDLEKLQGTWKVVSAVEWGDAVPADKVGDIRLTIDGDKVATTGGPGKDAKATIKLDASKSPPAIDVTPDDKDAPTMLGVYQLDGDTLKIALNRKGKDRPAEVASKADSGVGLMVLKREKKWRPRPAPASDPRRRRHLFARRL